MPPSNSIVLVVEDEIESRETLKELLEFEGYSVKTAANGQEALDLMASLGDEICIVLLDLFMPVMDGWKVIETLRADGRLKKSQIVVITSAAHLAPLDFPTFQKPLDLDKVIDAVAQLC